MSEMNTVINNVVLNVMALKKKVEMKHVHHVMVGEMSQWLVENVMEKAKYGWMINSPIKYS